MTDSETSTVAEAGIWLGAEEPSLMKRTWACSWPVAPEKEGLPGN
jgi:hypothetical protein